MNINRKIANYVLYIYLTLEKEIFRYVIFEIIKLFEDLVSHTVQKYEIH